MPDPGPRLVSQAEFARLVAVRVGREVARSTVKRWADAGNLVMVGKRVDADASLARMEALGVGRLRPDVAARHAQAARPMPTPAQSQENATAPILDATASATHDDTIADVDAGLSKARLKAAVLHYENSLIKLGLQLARGQRYDKTQVKDEAAGLGNALRAAVERLVDQTAPRLAVMPSHLDRGLLLRSEMRHVKRLIKLEHTASLRRVKKRSGKK